MAMIVAVSSISRLPTLPGKVSDKVEHAVEYAGLGALLVRAFAGGTWGGVRRGALVGAVSVAVLFGVSDELHQAFVPERECDVKDVAADALGAGAAAGALGAWSIIRRFSGVHDDRV